MNSNFSMFWRLWWRAVTVRRPQAALALGALAVGAALTSMLLNLYDGVRRKMTEDFRAYGANVVIAPGSKANGAGADDRTTMDESRLRPLVQFGLETPGASSVPVLYGVLRVSPHPTDSAFTHVVAAGAEFGVLRHMNPGWRETGEVVTADLPPGDCAVGSHLAAQLHLRVGDFIALGRLLSAVPSASLAPSGESGDRKGVGEGVEARVHSPSQVSAPPSTSFRIATILTTGTSEDDQVFLPLATLQSLLGANGRITLVELSIPGEAPDVERAVRRLASLLPDLEVRPIRQIVYSEGKVLGTIRWLLLSLTILILVIIALCVMSTMTAMVLERRKEIGMMKALGAADRQVMRLFAAEGASLGLVGGMLGYAAGVYSAEALGGLLFGVALGVNAWVLPLVCGWTVALAVIAAQVPVRIVRAVQPAVVLKGE